MKKRLVSIFLIVSIVASIFAVSAVSTSAACKADRPTLKAVLPYKDGRYINVNWSHNGRNTKFFGVSFRETGKTSPSICRYTANSKGRYLNVNGLKANTNYEVRVYAYDLNGQRSLSSDSFYVSTNPKITWVETFGGPSIGRDAQNKLIYTSKAIFGYNLFWSGTPSYYRIAQYINGRMNPSKPIIEKSTTRHSTGWYTNKQTVVCCVQAVFKVGNTEYTSAWSPAKKVG